MNSMNHYAYGAVFEWVYKNVCGLNPVAECPGFKRAVLRPQPDKRLGAAKAMVNTAAGYYESGWKYDGDAVTHVHRAVRRGGRGPSHRQGRGDRAQDAVRRHAYFYALIR